MADKYEVNARCIWSVLSKEDKEKSRKFTVSEFRALAKACPDALGYFTEKDDSLILNPAKKDCPEFREALRSYCRMSVEAYSDVVSRRSADKRGVHQAHKSAEAAAKRAKVE